MRVLGVMSGTSLDGLDLAICEFDHIGGKYSYKLKHARTIAYSPVWKKLLSEAKHASAKNYFRLHAEYGNYIATEINKLVKKSGLKPHAIASHGHTIFHQPASGFSTQMGCGATIASHTKMTTVCDFRSLDIANAGQGAPLVPLGDQLLFGKYQACLNIGGIANISYNNKKGNRMAYDICEANMLLNFLAARLGKSFDKNGEMARSGKINKTLLTELNSLEYYSKRGAKSIGREWFEKEVQKLLKGKNVNHLLATAVEHISQIIGQALNDQKIKNVLVTGGGAYNTYLLEEIKAKTSCELILPEKNIIEFKEALIFAFLGYLRLSGKTNTLASVTGAKQNSSGGAIYLAS